MTSPDPLPPATAWFPSPVFVNGASLEMIISVTVSALQVLCMTSATSSLAALGRLREVTRWEFAFLPPHPMIAWRP